ncbi:MAG: hypothetical protein RID53_11305 [Coleofasciculus sp. B1-GNL1-01]|uniref:hypothetical protein n=1 Tax=Coleofasciculus sp. B1-GNL1-01 TaxID=3068484 RepID=UPI0032FFC1A6
MNTEQVRQTFENAAIVYNNLIPKLIPQSLSLPFATAIEIAATQTCVRLRGLGYNTKSAVVIPFIPWLLFPTHKGGS